VSKKESKKEKVVAAESSDSSDSSDSDEEVVKAPSPVAKVAAKEESSDSDSSDSSDEEAAAPAAKVAAKEESSDSDSSDSSDDEAAPVAGEKRAAEVVEVAAKKVKTEEGPVAVAVAVPADQADVKTCFVGNMSFDLDEDTIWAAFDEWVGAGSVVSVRLITDRETQRPKGYVILSSYL
jgi:nucleolin